MHWSVKLDGGPRRVNHAAVAVGDKIYSFGGYCTNDNSAEGRRMDVHLLNTNNYRWSVVPYAPNIEELAFLPIGLLNYSDIPFQRYGHTAVSFQDNIYIWGGRNDQYACNRLFCFNTTSNEWKPVSVTGEIPGARDGHSACVYNGQMYIFGGFDEEVEHYCQSVYILDLTKMVWKSLVTTEDFPPHSDFHTAVVYDQKMYIFGGRGDKSGPYHTQEEIYFQDLMYLDLTNHKWHKPKCYGDVPVGRRSHSAFIYEDYLYIFGGYNAIVNEHYNHLYRLCFKTYKWEEVTPQGTPPCVRRRQACIVVDDRMFLFGGTTPMFPLTYTMDDKLLDHNDLHVLEFKPSLRMLCLIAVIKHKLSPASLPDILRMELRSMTTPNSISRQLNSTG